MSSDHQRPDVRRALSYLKDFQLATAQYAFRRLYGEEHPTRRFLVADEVGLGKTMVAKGVIAQAVDHLWDTTRRIDVIYICSNQAIARQNINRLNVTGVEDVSLSSRITMLPVEVGRLNERKLNFVSFTPATSFDLRSSLGMMTERAVLHCLLARVWGLRGAAPKNALQGNAGTDRFRSLVDYYAGQEVEASIAERFARVLQERVDEEQAAGKEDLYARWERLCGHFARDAERRNRPQAAISLQGEVVGELRDLLATVCLHSLEPDLIILDEFQRFKHLLADDTDESRLARDLFNYTDHESQARVLLLSATPYKMLTLPDEADGEDHYSDFLSTIRFLQNDAERTRRCEAILDQYRYHMLRLGSERRQALLELKGELELELRRVMARTERLAVTADRDGMLRQVPTGPVDVTASEARTYRGLGHLARMLEQPDPIEYWKSAPYLLSFMEEYDLKRRFRRQAEDPAVAPELATLIRANPELAVSWDDYRSYRKLDAGNGRLRWLQDRFIERGAWRLLWVPPARPWYRPEGPFADPALAGFTKLLIFSSWHVVPKAIASLTSYAAEREMMLSGGEQPENTSEAREFSPLLRFARDGGLSLFALLYPSFALARMGAETERDVGAELPTRDDLIEILETRIRSALRPFPDPQGGREDERWYWAAPALLDRRESESATMEWFDDPGLRSEMPGSREEDEDEEEAMGVLEDEHIPALREQLGANGEKLGRRPADLCRVLAQLALSGPAVSALRALTNLYGQALERTDARMRGRAWRVANAFRSYFNLPEVTSLVRGAEKEVPYWRQVLGYAVDGGLGAVMEEYAHVLYEWLGLAGHPVDETVEKVAGAMISALTLRTANPGMDEIVTAPDGSGVTIQPRRMRSRFAARLGEDTFEGGKLRTRTDQVRKAFNSPFWPFVLATTSVGQEGLDFHLYCHAVAHWNLPSNPVDLEQREGRVHRYKGHAVRKNVAARHGHSAHVPMGEDPWQAMFESASLARPSGVSDLFPYWIYPVAGGAQIERHVPLFPLSREVGRYTRLRRSATLYRMVFGQPRQEDLLEFLMATLPTEEAGREAAALRLDLSPARQAV